MDNNRNNNIVDVDNDQEQEINLLELAAKLWAQRRTIVKWCCIGIVAGLIVAFSIPREYSTTVKLAPEFDSAKSGRSGGLSSLASLAGINLNQGASVDAVYPELYPDILSSKPFAVGLLSVELPNKDGEVFTVEEIFKDHTSSPWWSWVMSLPFKAIGAVRDLFTADEESIEGATIDPFRLTAEQSRMVDGLSKRVSASVDKKTSIVTISVMMQDPVAAAHLADSVVTRLQKYITRYRTEKSRQDLAYAQKINEEARQAYYKAQKTYAEATDRNHSLSSRSAAIELERLQNEASLAFSLYNSTAQRAQLAEAKVQETTPVFAVVQPSSVPVKPSKPSKAMVLIGFVFLAFVASAAYILYFPMLKEVLKTIKSPLPSKED